MDSQQIRSVGHDHGASLDKALKTTNFKTSHLLILDSDCFPTNDSWLNTLSNIELASDPSKHGLSHPCFMSIPCHLLSQINFSQGVNELGIDVGRLVGLQLSNIGLEVKLTVPVQTFRGLRGVQYNNAIYHHGSASFLSSKEERIKKQVNKKVEIFFKRKIKNSDFTLNFFENLRIRILLNIFQISQKKNN